MHDCVKVIRVGFYILGGPVDVLGHVSAATERLVVHVVGLILTAGKTTIHTLGGGGGEKSTLNSVFTFGPIS